MIDEIKWRLGVAPDWRPGYEQRDRQDPRSTREEVFAEEPRQVHLPPRSSTEEAGAAPGNWSAAPNGRNEKIVDGDGSDGGQLHASTDNLTTEVIEAAAAGEGLPADHSSMMRPAGISSPRSGVADNLQRIRGIGKRNEALLHSFGIYHFGQIAAWTPAEARWVASHLAFPESLEGDDWIGQAIVLASGGDTGYLPRSERRKRAREEESED
jgi:NADH-quinone oxidoreductase subunit E